MEGGESMSFLEPLLASAGPAASGLGHLIGVDPGRVASIAGNIGKGMNQIATAGGASPAYQDPGVPAVQNHFQLLDDNVLRAIIDHFSGGGLAHTGDAVIGARRY
jgi:hypothetical protein